MIELDGKEFELKTASENTKDLLDTINNYCAENNVKNSKDEVIFIEENMSSPIYIILWAMGYLITVIQNLIYGLGKLLSIQSSPESGLLNLADMAAVKRGSASVTTFQVYLRAMTTDDENFNTEAGVCTITTDDVCTYQGITYAPAVYPSLILQPGEAGYITMVAQASGSFEISEGAITMFDTQIANLASFEQSAAIPGQEEESLSDLRLRMQRRQISGTSIDAAMDAIRALEGVTVCNIYYNTNISSSVQIGADGIEVPPRTALCLVQGYNPNIAQTYFSYITAPSIKEVNLNGHSERLLAKQVYTTHANQEISLLLVTPDLLPLYVTVYIGMAVSSTIELELKEAVCRLAKGLTVGETITTADVLNVLKDYSTYSVVGAMLSDGVSAPSYTTTNLTLQSPDVLWTFNIANISIVMPEVADD